MKSYLNQSLVQFIWPPSHAHPAGTPTALSLFPDCTSPAPGEEVLASRCTNGCSMGAAGLPRVALWSLFSKSPKSQRLLEAALQQWKAILQEASTSSTTNAAGCSASGLAAPWVAGGDLWKGQRSLLPRSGAAEDMASEPRNIPPCLQNL